MDLRFQSKQSQRIGQAAVVILSLLALLSLARSVQITFFSPAGGTDFHSYWYAGLFVRQQTDPFAAFLSGEEPDAPINFIGGRAEPEALSRTGVLATTPANTAPIVLLLTPFAWLPWPVANAIWFGFNLLLVIILPWLALRWLPQPANLAPLATALFFLTFYTLKATRFALTFGQTTLLVLALMFLCLLTWHRSWLIAGLFLGIALSKYSIALPLFLYALYRRKFKVALVAVLVQLSGLLIMSLLTGGSPLSIMRSNLTIMQLHSIKSGIHLSWLFANSSTMYLIAPILLTAFILITLLWLRYRRWGSARPPAAISFRNRHLMAVLALWTLLVAYHRSYDGVLVIFFMIVVLYGFSEPGSWQLTRRQRRGLGWFVIFAVVMFIVPNGTIDKFLTANSGTSLDTYFVAAFVVTLAAMLAISLWLMGRIGMEEKRAG